MAFGTIWERISNLRSGRQFAPNKQVDWSETYEAHIFTASVPGLKKDEVRVQVLNCTTLEIRGERKKEEVQEGIIWHHTQRPIGNFSRQFELPYGICVHKLHARVQDGVLTVEIPKRENSKPEVHPVEIA